MPALPAVPSVVKIVLSHFLGEDVNAVNIFHQKYSGPPNTLAAADAATWATVVKNQWVAHLQSFFASALILETVTVTDLSSATGATGSDVTPHAGTNANPVLAAGTALCMREHVGRRYRGGHPRQYLAGLVQSDLTDVQRWDATFLANLTTAYTTFRNNIGAFGPPPALVPAIDVNVSYYHGFTPFTYPSGRVRNIPTLRPAPVVDTVTSFSANAKVASQRRRNLQGV